MEMLALEKYQVEELDGKEQTENTGGGPIADFIADAFYSIKCGCKPTASRWSVDASGAPVPEY